MHMDLHQDYYEAKRLLKAYFGDEIKVSHAYMQKALNWANIRSDDGKALHAYALHLRGCYKTMQDLLYMAELDSPSNQKMIILKLPYKLCERFRTTSCDILERTGHRVGFWDLVEFLERQAKILLDLLFGVNQNPMSGKGILKPKFTDLKQQSNSSRSSFDTAVAIVSDTDKSFTKDNSSVMNEQNNDPGSSCIFCTGET